MMNVALIWLTVVCLASLSWTACGEDGHCVWYGQCGEDPTTRKPRNCYYNGTAKPFKTSQALDLYKDYCPDLYNGSDTRTCCSDDQMLVIVGNMEVPKQALNRCPSCLRNFLNIYCYLTCAPDQSKFLHVNVSTWNDTSTNTSKLQVTAVDYYVTNQFAYGVFNSCRDVQMPSADEPALSILCGRPAAECTPKKWFGYMGSISNSQTPFQIDFHIADRPVRVGCQVMTSMNASILPCSPYCACTDCGTCSPSTCPQPPNPFDRPSYRLEQIFIKRSGHHPPVVHYDPPPAITTTTFTPIFDKEFLHQVLDLQLEVEALRAPYQNGTVGLKDICFQPLAPVNTHCTIQSILNYFQNSHQHLDRRVMDPAGFFVMADYLDHFLYCVKHPYSVNDTTALHGSCLGAKGGAVFPWTALQDYDGLNYKNATTLVINFVVNNHYGEGKNAKAEAWEKVFIDFMKNYTRHQPNMTIAFAVGDTGYFPNWMLYRNDVAKIKGAAPQRPTSRGASSWGRVVPLK